MTAAAFELLSTRPRSPYLLSLDASDRELVTRTGQPISFARASAGMLRDELGRWIPAVYGVPRLHQFEGSTPGVFDQTGWLFENAKTNAVRWNRDLTNAVWTKTNCTATHNQTGVDGGSATASRLVATAGNATCLQAITLASSERYQSAYIRRLTGSGTIQMTMDNGSTWTTVIATSEWTRVVIPTQTLANPTVGFRLVTSGDAIAVDLVQNEDHPWATSPLPTTSAAVARVADAPSLTIGWTPMDMTWYLRISREPWMDLPGTLQSNFAIAIGTTDPTFLIYFSESSRAVVGYFTDHGAGAYPASLAIPAGPVIEVCAQFTNVLTACKVRIDVGAGFGSFSPTSGPITAFGSQHLRLGDSPRFPGFSLNAALSKVRIAKGLHTLAAMREGW